MTEDKTALRQGRELFAKGVDFILSAPKEEFLPPPTLPEVAIAGRSNVGKSSLINAITGQAKLARTSNTPGRTQELNYFKVAHKLYLVDTPGYGYAKAPKNVVHQWQLLITDYLAYRVPLKRVFLLIDSRHGIMKNDLEIMEILDKAAAPYQIVLTKIDKIKPTALRKLIEATEDAIKKHPAAFPTLIATSSEKNKGLDELKAAIAQFV